jgi:integrase/recombinase XerD
LRGYADRTVEAYVRAVAQLARSYNVSPDQLTEEQVRGYLVHLGAPKVARSTHTIALCGIKFFFEHTLGRSWTILGVARPKAEKKLPVVLGRDEVWKILGSVRNPAYRACLTTINSCGLRLLEGAHLRVSDVDGERKMLRVRGKGGKERFVPLPEGTLQLLRQHWRTHRHPTLLFPARPRRQPADPAALGPLTNDSLQKAFKRALASSGIRKRAHVHTLRHYVASRTM